MKTPLPFSLIEFISFLGFGMGIFSILNIVNIQLYWSIAISLFSFLTILGIVSIHRIWLKKKNEFHVYKDVEGNASKKDIIDASESILFTHFTEDKPSNAYIELLLEKLQNTYAIH